MSFPHCFSFYQKTHQKQDEKNLAFDIAMFFHGKVITLELIHLILNFLQDYRFSSFYNVKIPISIQEAKQRSERPRFMKSHRPAYPSDLPGVLLLIWNTKQLSQSTAPRCKDQVLVSESMTEIPELTLRH